MFRCRKFSLLVVQSLNYLKLERDEFKHGRILSS